MNQSPTAEDLVASLVRLLTVQPDIGSAPESADPDHFTGDPQIGGVGRVFGGQVIAQALQAAQRSVPEEKVAHSLHAYFLRGGQEGPAIDYSIARDFDGRSFANRRVVASQNGTPILNLTASFQKPESGLEHQEFPMPDVTGPEELKSDMEQRQTFLDMIPNVTEDQRRMVLRPRPIEMRTVEPLHWMNKEPRQARTHTWVRTVAPLPDDPALHRAVIAYASDLTLLGNSILPHGLSMMREEVNVISLDHVVWYHSPARADDWLLHVTDSPWTGGGRGFNRGSLYTRDGTLVASIAQEGVVRRRIKRD